MNASAKTLRHPMRTCSDDKGESVFIRVGQIGSLESKHAAEEVEGFLGIGRLGVRLDQGIPK